MSQIIIYTIITLVGIGATAARQAPARGLTLWGDAEIDELASQGVPDRHDAAP